MLCTPMEYLSFRRLSFEAYVHSDNYLGKNLQKSRRQTSMINVFAAFAEDNA